MRNNLFISNSKKRIIISVLFIIITVSLIFCISRVLRFKYYDGIEPLDVFYKQDKDSIDVLVLGSSHAFININPAVLYDEEGIAAFNLCGSAQPFWNTYYYLKEALKYQRPKLILLEAYEAVCADDYTESSRTIKNTYGLRWSKVKWDSLMVSVPKKDRKEFFFEFLQFHNRYEEISQKDFSDYLTGEPRVNWKGQIDSFYTVEMNKPVFSNNPTGYYMTDKTRTYYEKILELAKSEDIPVCVVITPYMDYRDDDRSMFLEAKNIAAGYEANFIDLNEYYDEIGINLSTDFVDTAHMNYIGNEKLSRYLADYIKAEYDIPDRRGDEKYISYEINSEYRKQNVLDNTLSGINEAEEYRSFLEKEDNRKNFTIIYSFTSLEGKKEVGLWKNGKVIFQEAGEKYIHYPDKWNTIEIDKNCNIKLNTKVYKKTDVGYNVVVYDNLNKRIADCVGINIFDNNKLIR